MRDASMGLLLLSLLFLVGRLSNAVELGAVPRALAWSSKTYGPDGPWHAVTVKIGSPPQIVDLFPGGFWQSNILSSSICSSAHQVQSQTCFAQQAGFYDTSKSSTITTVSEAGSVENSTFADKGVLSLFGSGDYAFDKLSIATIDPPSTQVGFDNFDMLVIDEGSWTLPGGGYYPIQVGNLALGAPEVNQSWSQEAKRFNSSLVPSSLYLAGKVPSNSFGLHIGSTAMGIPPSLYVGGYDQSRVLGQVTMQDYNMHYFPIDLLDIGIGVASGSSPFPSNSSSGLLARGNSSMGISTQVIVDPIAPYLYLPNSTCEAITQYLPVTYQTHLGLYFWDTSSPMYKQIVSSSSYLSFTFRQNSSITQNITINVPFSLLNLTLEAPLVSSPRQYFPCTSFDTGKSYGIPTLGKAFLQAAFLGVNWGLDGKGLWFLAQAPGPNTPSQAVVNAIGLDDDFILPSTNDWRDTWKGVWNVAGTNGSVWNGSQSETILDKPGLSTTVIGSIVAGVIVFACLCICCILFLCWKKRKARRAKTTAQHIQYEKAELEAGRRKTVMLEVDARTPLPRAELEGMQRRVELQG